MTVGDYKPDGNFIDIVMPLEDDMQYQDQPNKGCYFSVHSLPDSSNDLNSNVWYLGHDFTQNYFTVLDNRPSEEA